VRNNLHCYWHSYAKRKAKLQKVGFLIIKALSTVFPEENGIRGSWAGRGAALRAEGRHVQQAGLAIKNPPKKNHLKKPTKNVFFLILNFYGNNTNFSL
jgi:hypothetical protein